MTNPPQQPTPEGPSNDPWNTQQPQDPQAFGGAPQAFPEEPKSGSKVKSILSGVVVLALVAVGGFFMWDRFQTQSALEVGNCVVVSGSEDDADIKKVDCDDEDFNWGVGKVESTMGACGDGYLEFSYSMERRGRTTSTTVGCLWPNFQVDQCYDDAPADSPMGFQRVDCPGGYFEVTSVEESVDAQCTGDSFPGFIVPEPARTFCVMETA